MIDKYSITKEVIDKCFHFISNEKNGKYTLIYDMKNDEFPNSLLIGTKQQQEIIKLLENKTTRQVGQYLNISASAVVQKRKKYIEGFKFYEDWILFWNFIKPLRQLYIKDIFNEQKYYSIEENKTIKNFLKNSQRKKINTIEDLLLIYIHKKERESRSVIYIDNKKIIFKIIKEKIDELYTSTTQNFTCGFVEMFKTKNKFQTFPQAPQVRRLLKTKD